MSEQIKINNPIEKDINRNEFVINQNAGSLIFTNTTGNQRVQLTGKDGGNIYINSKVVSTFAPSNCQSLTKGDKFDNLFFLSENKKRGTCPFLVKINIPGVLLIFLLTFTF